MCGAVIITSPRGNSFGMIVIGCETRSSAAAPGAWAWAVLFLLILFAERSQATAAASVRTVLLA